MSNVQRNAKNRGRANEYQIVEKLSKLRVTDAERVPLSGALAKLPGDVDAPSIDTLFEAKVYETVEVKGARYIRVDLNWVHKIIGEAKRFGRAFGVVALRGKGLRETYVIMTLEDYVRLQQASKSL